MVSMRAAAADRALLRAKDRIHELGDDKAWEHWPDDPVINELLKIAGDRPAALGFAVQSLLATPSGTPSREASQLAVAYVCGALLLALARGRWALPQATSSRQQADAATSTADCLARALAAIAEARQRSRSNPGLQLELRGLHHALAQVRAAVVNAEQGAARQARRSRKTA